MTGRPSDTTFREIGVSSPARRRFRFARPALWLPRDAAPLAVLLVFAWFAASAGWRPLLSPDEGRYAGVMYEMLRSGHWAVPQLDGLPFFHKPPLFYWIGAAAMALLGPSDWAARLPSVLGATAAVVALYLFVRRWVGIRSALLSAVVLATLPFFYVGAQYANLDMLVAGCITATVLLAVHAVLLRERLAPHRGALAGAFAAAALGVLAKGLIGLVLPGAVFVLWCLATRRFRTLLLLAWPPGWLLLMGITAPWFLLMQASYPAFLDYFFVTQHFRRFADAGFNNEHPVWFYAPVLAVFMLPWLAWWLYGAWRDHRRASRHGLRSSGRRSDIDRLMWIWWLVVVVFFSLPRSKLVGYVLPALPPLACLAARGALAAVERSGRGLRALRWTMAGAAALCVAAVGALGWSAPSPMAGLDTTALRQSAAEEPVLMLDAYVYELPMAWRLREPVSVWADWMPEHVAQHDNWRKELFDAGEFDPGARDRLLLVGLDGLARVLCTARPTRVVSSPAAPQVFPWLARAERLAANPEIAVWRFPGSAGGDPDCLRSAADAAPAPAPVALQPPAFGGEMMHVSAMRAPDLPPVPDPDANPDADADADADPAPVAWSGHTVIAP